MSVLPYSVSAAALQSVVPDEARGSAAAIFLLVSNIPAALGPTAVALLSDHVFTEMAGIRYSMLCFGLVSVVCGGGLSWVSAMQFPRPDNAEPGGPGPGWRETDART